MLSGNFSEKIIDAITDKFTIQGYGLSYFLFSEVQGLVQIAWRM